MVGFKFIKEEEDNKSISSYGICRGEVICIKKEIRYFINY